VNGYLGEPKESVVPFEVLLAWATEGLNNMNKSDGLECLKLESDANEDILKNAMKYIDAWMDSRGLDTLEGFNDDPKAFCKRLNDKKTSILKSKK